MGPCTRTGLSFLPRSLGHVCHRSSPVGLAETHSRVPEAVPGSGDSENEPWHLCPTRARSLMGGRIQQAKITHGGGRDWRGKS